MSVSRNVIFIVLNHDEIAVAAQLVPDIDNFTRSRRINRRSARARNIDPYFRPPRWNKVKSLYRWQAIPNNAAPPAAEDFGTEDDGLTAAVFVAVLLLVLRVELLLFALPRTLIRCPTSIV